MTKTTLAALIVAFLAFACAACGGSSSERPYTEYEKRLIGTWVGVWRSAPFRRNSIYRGCGPIRVEIILGFNAIGSIGWAKSETELAGEQCLDVGSTFSGHASGKIDFAGDETMLFRFNSPLGEGIGEISGKKVSGSAFVSLGGWSRKVMTFDGKFHDKCISGKFLIALEHEGEVEICRLPADSSGS